ncbi:hypothetical protein [Magnetofaba australis]|uniref:hypothetical protein n=1 Tax=Magnetofaba australis TaxID=1472297 RepID=UPI000A19F122|nr:hypothetical protein [Magnetofaba australis]
MQRFLILTGLYLLGLLLLLLALILLFVGGCFAFIGFHERFDIQVALLVTGGIALGIGAFYLAIRVFKIARRRQKGDNAVSAT